MNIQVFHRQGKRIIALEGTTEEWRAAFELYEGNYPTNKDVEEFVKRLAKEIAK